MDYLVEAFAVSVGAVVIFLGGFMIHDSLKAKAYKKEVEEKTKEIMGRKHWQ